MSTFDFKTATPVTSGLTDSYFYFGASSQSASNPDIYALSALLPYIGAGVMTLTNKTFDTAGTGNSLSINGVAATANTGTGAIARASSPTFVTPTLGAATATSINNLTITSSTGTLTIAAAKVLTVSNSGTLAGGDAFTLAIAAAKTLTVSNTLTLAGTDSTTMTFPSVSASIPGLAVANVFTTLQTITQANANTGILASTGYSLTGSNATNMLDFAGTLNTSGNPIILKIALTNTASGATTKFASFLAGASGTTEVFSVDKAGLITTASQLYFGSSSNRISTANNYLYFTAAGNDTFVVQNTGIGLASNVNLHWTASGADQAADLILTRNAAATLQLGAADAASAVAQTLRVQSVVAGTADTAGGNWTLDGSVSTGTGTPGDIIFKTAGKGAASTVQNTLITALTIKGGTTNNTNVGYPSVVIGNAALGTTATDGFLYIAGGAGPPTGVPTAFTGRYPLYWDTTNKQLFVYDAAWLQPKTPAAAAIVNWQ